jgi:uncharacterized membrane protein YidH (DUF202 family)
MTPRTLFTILIKIFGISLLMDALTIIPQFLGTASTIGQSYSTDSLAIFLIIIVLVLIIMAIYLLFIRACLFKTDFIINKLSLDKHFTEEKFEINVDHTTILPIAIIVIGGLLIIDALPDLCRELFSYIQQQRQEGQGFANPSLSWIIFFSIKLSIGYLLISNNKRLTKWIEKKRVE